MEIGIGVPRAPDVAGLKRFTQKAEQLGFESALVGDHIVLATEESYQYPYSADGSFFSPSDDPFLETMTVLGYLAACTDTIKIGSTVIILPYRDPVVQAKMFASLDVLSNGRIICGVGVGWLEKEFEVLRAPYADRGAMSDEILEIFRILWSEEYPEFHGKFYNFDGIQFYPKPVQKPYIPIWVGGHSKAALRRTAKFGDCWHTSRQSPEFVADNIPYLRQRTEAAGRDPDSVSVSLKRSVHFTDIGIPESSSARTNGALVGSTQEVLDDLYSCREIGIHQLTFDFRVDSLDDSIRVMEHLADRLLPAAKRLG